MKLHENFLPTDMVEASKQYSNFQESLKSVTTHLDNGEMYAAKHKAIELLNSLHELTQLAEKKSTIDRWSFMMDQMNQVGIHIQVVRGLHHER